MAECDSYTVHVPIQGPHPLKAVFIDQLRHSSVTEAFPFRRLLQIQRTNAAGESHFLKDPTGGSFVAQHIPRFVAAH